jgi:release factor glutamine methyltransferase
MAQETPTRSPEKNVSARTLDVRGALKEGLARLREARAPSHSLAAELLLLHVLGRDRAWLYAHPEEILEEASISRYFELVEQRAAGTPTQHLTGRQEFWGLEFEVTPDVLIPRPETEHVVEVALERLGPVPPGGAPRGQGLQVADVGTGSGCLAVALARELPAAEIVATDVSEAALAVAKRNAQRHGVLPRVRFVQGDLLGPLLEASRRFNLIVSNPPYVARHDAATLAREVGEHEPAQALFGGDHGAELYGALIGQAEALLVPGGALVLEIGYNLLDFVQPLCGAMTWRSVRVTNDLAGIPRVISAQRA